MFAGRRFDLYVLRELWTPTLLGLTLYTFVLLMNHFFVVAEKALSKNLGLSLALQLFLVGVPQLLVLSIPMAVLLGTLIGMGRFSSDSEWVALQGAGHGPPRLLRPVVIHGLLGTLAGFFIYAVVVPQANFTLRNLRGEVLFASHLAADLRPRVFYELPGLEGSPVLYVEDIRPGEAKRLVGVTLIQRDSLRGSTELVRARFGDLYPDPARNGTLIVDLYDGVAHLYDESGEQYRGSRFEFLRRPHDSKSFIQALLKPPNKVVQDFSLEELWDEYRLARETHRRALESTAQPPSGGQQAPSLRTSERRLAYATVELHQRVALPLASLVFALLAMPLGIVQVRTGKGAGFAVSLLAILIYYATFKPIRNAALAGNFPAVLGPWLADAVILTWAVVAYWRLRYRTGRSSFLARLINATVAVIRRLPGLPPRRPGPVALESSAPDNGDDDNPNDDATEELATLGGTSTRFVGRLDQYVGRVYLRVLGLSLASGYLVYALVEIQGLADDLLRSGQPFSLVLSYLQYFAPSVFPVVLPVSCLVAGVVTFTLLNRSDELVAIKASGMSMRRATAPVLLLTLLFCGLQFLVQDSLAPAASRKAQAIKDQISGRLPRTYGQPLGGRWSFGPEGRRLYHYRNYDPREQSFDRLHVFSLEPGSPRILDHRASRRASWTGETWKVEGGWYRGFPSDGRVVYEDNRERSYDQELDSPETFAGRQLSLARPGAGEGPEQMSLVELSEELRTLEDSGLEVTEYRVAYHSKLAHALAPLVMVLLGLPFSFKVGRRGSLYGVGVALLLVLVYWTAFAVFQALGQESLLHPFLAAWAPNFLFGLLGTYLMLYVKT